MIFDRKQIPTPSIHHMLLARSFVRSFDGQARPSPKTKRKEASIDPASSLLSSSHQFPINLTSSLHSVAFVVDLDAGLARLEWSGWSKQFELTGQMRRPFFDELRIYGQRRMGQ